MKTKRKTTSKTTRKPGLAPPFKKGNKVGKQFKPGNKAAVGFGRPENLRGVLKEWVKRQPPERVRSYIREVCPKLTAAQLKKLDWRDAAVAALLVSSSKGELGAIGMLFKQLDDEGKDRTQIEFGEDIQDAARDFTRKISRLTERSEED